MTYQIIYASSASRPMNSSNLQELLNVARRNNARSSVTGMLLYRDGNFIQLLEGEKSAVKRTFEVIKADTRHRGIFVLDERETDERALADWSMGYREIAENDAAAAGLFRLTEQAIAEKLGPEVPREILLFMRNFYMINRS